MIEGAAQVVGAGHNQWAEPQVVGEGYGVGNEPLEGSQGEEEGVPTGPHVVGWVEGAWLHQIDG